MKTINIHEAKSQLSALIAKTLAGEDVVISKAGKPVVKLVAYTKPLKKRVPGLLKGKIWISDDFTKEDPEINKMFYGE